MGVYYTAGVVFGYMVDDDEVPEGFDGLWDFAEVVCKMYPNLSYTIAGDSYSGDHEAVVFTDKEARTYESIDSSINGFGFAVADLELVEPDVADLVEHFELPERPARQYIFLSVY